MILLIGYHLLQIFIKPVDTKGNFPPLPVSQERAKFFINLNGNATLIIFDQAIFFYEIIFCHKVAYHVFSLFSHFQYTLCRNENNKNIHNVHNCNKYLSQISRHMKRQRRLIHLNFSASTCLSFESECPSQAFTAITNFRNPC